ncbi:Txe/YoeB family addiction module toxin [Azonexus sp.]|uniref:Txe/YoeB family addiction module toxin n=1 Tax=Azonexus sp. TaxID=1872668 RepID=UPI0035AF48E6
MPIKFSDHAWDDYLFWQQADKAALKRIHLLLKDIQRTPFEGLGKPEPLRHNLSGLWSRRIDEEHRLVYAIDGDCVVVLQCRYHYLP